MSPLATLAAMSNERIGPDFLIGYITVLYPKRQCHQNCIHCYSSDGAKTANIVRELKPLSFAQNLGGKVKTMRKLLQKQFHKLVSKERRDAWYEQMPQPIQWTWDKLGHDLTFTKAVRSQKDLRLPARPQTPGRFERRICKLCNIEDWQDENWLRLLDELGESDQRRIQHRKAWEWAQGMFALQKLGLLHENATALGVGAGIEKVLFHLTNYIQMVYATDIYGQGSFSEETAYGDMLTHPERYCSIPFRPDHLTVMYMDGRQLDFPDNTFDFAFCFSSIEHFGGHEAASQSMREMARVIKPGGCIIITTEVVVNGVAHDEFFLPHEVDEYLIAPTGLQLIEEIDYTLSDQTLKTIVDFNAPDFLHILPHILCKYANVYWTSICLVLEKPVTDSAAG
jgi:SAM-dependent methyltransferase